MLRDEQIRVCFFKTGKAGMQPGETVGNTAQLRWALIRDGGHANVAVSDVTHQGKQRMGAGNRESRMKQTFHREGGGPPDSVRTAKIRCDRGK
jgi:hypothetical protein